MPKNHYLYVEDVGFKCHVACNCSNVHKLYLFQKLCEELLLDHCISKSQLESAVNLADEHRIMIQKVRDNV